MATDDVLQIYIKDTDTEYAVLNPALAAFKRIISMEMTAIK